MDRRNRPSDFRENLDGLVELGWLLVMIVIYLMMPVVLMSGRLPFWDVMVWLPWWIVAGGALSWTITERRLKRPRRSLGQSNPMMLGSSQKSASVANSE